MIAIRQGLRKISVFRWIPGVCWAWVRAHGPVEWITKNFVDFLATDEASKILRHSGYLPLRTESDLVQLKKEE